MNITKERQGELFIFSEAFLWSLFPVITILSFNKLSPLVSLAGSAVFATVFFIIILTLKKKWFELKNLSGLKNALIATLFVGIIYYLLYFFGLRHTNAGNASLIALTSNFFNYLFFHFWRKEPIPRVHIFGGILSIAGAFIVLYPKIGAFTGGELLVLAASSITPVGNMFQQRARKDISSDSIMFVRSIVTAIVISFLVIALKDNFTLPALKNSVPFLLINGVVLLGFSKTLWLEGIHRISVTKASAMESTTPLLTLIFAWILLNNPPTEWQLLAFVPMFFGILLLGKKAK